MKCPTLKPLTVLFAAFGLTTLTSFAIPYTWNGSFNQDWDQPANWSPAGIPGPGDSATISAFVSAGDRELTSLNVTGGALGLGSLVADTIVVSNGTINVVSCTVTNLTVNPFAALNVTNALDINPGGSWTWTGGTVGGHPITVPASATLSIPTGNCVLGSGSVLDHFGSATMNGGNIQGNSTCTINNKPGASWSISTPLPFTNNFGANVFNNEGVLQCTAGTVDLRNWTYELRGETRATAGVFDLTGTVNVRDGASFTGGGATHFNGAVALDGAATATSGTVRLKGGALTNTTPAEIVGTLNWDGGYLAGDFSVNPGSDLIIAGTDLHHLATNATLDNYDTVRWDGPGQIRTEGTSLIHNHVGGDFVLNADGNPIIQNFGNNRFENDGTLIKSGGAGGTVTLSTITYNFNAGSTLTCNNGTIELTSLSNFAGGSQISGGAKVQFNGGVNLLGQIAETIHQLEFTGGSIDGSGPASIVGTALWTNGWIGGVLDIPAGSTLEVSGPANHVMNTLSVINVDGTLRWLGPGAIRGNDRVELNIRPGGLFDVTTDGNLLLNNFSGNVLDIEGELRKSGGGSGSTDIANFQVDAEGEINCQTGITNLFSNFHLENGCQFLGGGTVNLRGNTYLDGAVMSTDRVSIAAGTFFGDGGAVSGEINWNGGWLANTPVIATDGKMTISGAAGKSVGTLAALRIQGEVEFSDGIVIGNDQSRIEVLAGGLFTASGPAELRRNFGGNVFEVQPGGEFVAEAGADFTINTGFAVDNNDLFRVENGAIVHCRGGGISSGEFRADPGGLLVFDGGEQKLQAGATTSGPGEVRVATGGTLSANDASVQAYVELRGGSVGSRLAGGEFVFKGDCIWENGTVFDTARVPGGATLTVNGSTGGRWIGTTSVLTNEGTIRWDGPGWITGNDRSTLINEPTGQIELNAEGTAFTNNYGGNVLINRGRVVKAAGSGETLLRHWTYQHEGSLGSEAAGSLVVEATTQFRPGVQITGPGRTILRAGQNEFDGTTTVSGGTLELGGAEIKGHVNGSGNLAGAPIEWTAGYTSSTMTFSGTVNTPGATQKVIGTNAELRIAGQLTHNGTGRLVGNSTSTMRILPSGRTVLTGPLLANNFGGNQLINEGTLTVGAPATPTAVQVRSPFTQTSTGTLELDVAGANPATPEFDRLAIGGSATIAGTVRPQLIGGYDPVNGTDFEVLTATGGLSGTFDDVFGTRFNDGYSATAAYLEATPGGGLDYSTWATNNGLTGSDADPTADPDGDTIDNWGEYVWNLDPNAADVLPFTGEILEIDSARCLVLHYRTWQGRIDAGVIYSSQQSTDLEGWTATGVIDEVDPFGVAIPDSEARRARIPLDSSAGFLRNRADLAL